MRQTVLDEETIPNYIDLLVINNSSETCIKIKEENRKVDYVIVHTISEAFINGWNRLGKLEQIDTQSPKPLTVKEFIETVYIPTFFTTLKKTTRISYEQYLNLNIYPFLGDYPLNEVKVDTIQRFYNWMATASQRGRKADLNKNTIERVRGLTSRIFKVAQEMGIITDSPFKNTLLRIHATSGTHHNALDDEMVAKIKQQIPQLQDIEERLYTLRASRSMESRNSLASDGAPLRKRFRSWPKQEEAGRLRN